MKKYESLYATSSGVANLAIEVLLGAFGENSLHPPSVIYHVLEKIKLKKKKKNHGKVENFENQYRVLILLIHTPRVSSNFDEYLCGGFRRSLLKLLDPPPIHSRVKENLKQEVYGPRRSA